METETGQDMTVQKTGTTTVGLVTTEGVVLAADRRASLGGQFVSNKQSVKIERIHPTAAVTLSGSVGAGQAFIRQLRSTANLYEARRGESMSMDALARTAGRLLRGTRSMPLLGGVDEDGPRVFQIDPAGGVLEDTYTASGSGTQLATGALERLYEEELTLSEGVSVATQAVESAIERDTASGNGITVARITSEDVMIDIDSTSEEVH
ncbi:proteasome subunit beta [Halocatena salina]|uniref:Proteasome subunit beta n=1 Tax=Halocatena salina TaxID=2934340 RepID=A0A8T9ZYV8_9EURY|nr:proteasome subunit beta [Halocatena salina]UPM41921.1 proteasome subunit beta [Halocatena salina]